MYVSFDKDEEGAFKRVMELNNIVFITTGFFLQDEQEDTHIMCFDNTFGGDCYEMTALQNFINNTFGNNCYGNTFGNSCYNNTFGNNCYDNTFYKAWDNTFANCCDSNNFKDVCNINKFGNHFFGNDIYVYLLGNTFGNNCYNITFTNKEENNICLNNTFGDGCECIKIMSPISCSIFENGTKYIELISDDDVPRLDYITIHRGINGTYQNNKIITITGNAHYGIDVYDTNSQTIKV